MPQFLKTEFQWIQSFTIRKKNIYHIVWLSSSLCFEIFTWRYYSKKCLNLHSKSLILKLYSHHQVIASAIFFKVMMICVELAMLFEWVNIRRLAHRYVTDSQKQFKWIQSFTIRKNNNCYIVLLLYFQNYVIQMLVLMSCTFPRPEFVWFSFIIFTNPSARAGYDTRSIFKRSLTGFNSEYSFS